MFAAKEIAGRKDFLHAHILDLLREFVAEDLIGIQQQIPWRGVPRKCFVELLGSPLRGGRVGRDAEVADPAALVSQHQEHGKDFKADCRHGEEIYRDQALHAILKEAPP